MPCLPQGRLTSSLGEEGWSANRFWEGNGRCVGVLARIREDVTCLKQRGSVLDPRREDRGRLGRPGFARRVGLAVRNADRALLALTLMVTVVAPMWVAFQVRVESRYPSRRVLAVVVPIRVRGKVLMEMSQRGEGEEKDERGDLEARNDEVKKWAMHGVSFSSALRPKSTVLGSALKADMGTFQYRPSRVRSVSHRHRPEGITGSIRRFLTPCIPSGDLLKRPVLVIM